MLDKLGGLLGGASAGSVLSGGLRDLIERFRQSGHGQAADSWVSTGPNQELRSDQLEQAIGPDALKTLRSTPASREELLSRLTEFRGGGQTRWRATGGAADDLALLQ
jgi:uncharacterized protein YidB (DUF937 family)